MPFSFEAFLLRYGPMARALARRLARPPAEAEDLVQEAALALHRALAADPARFPQVEDARNYFLRALQNQSLRTHRGAPAPAPLGAEVPSHPPDPERLAFERRQAALGQLLRQLDAQGRTHLRRRFHEHATLAALSAETGVPLSTLHSREQKLLAQLRRELERLED